MSLKQIIKNWLYSDSNVKAVPMAEQNSSLQQPATLNLQVYTAIGGKVVEFRSYDQKTDRVMFSTYLITDSENVGEKLSKIITLELLKY